MVKTAPDIYGPYLTKYKKGESVLYVRLLNALYGIMCAAILYYQHFVKDITKLGFKINAYDPCIANKTVDGTHLTIVWHMDDLKVSYLKTAVVMRMAKWLKTKYEQVLEDGSREMKISRGKIHEYLGMTLDFSSPGELKVTMIPYVKEIVEQFSQHDPGESTTKTPAAEHLFKVNEEARALSEWQAKVFHNFVVKSLFLMK